MTLQARGRDPDLPVRVPLSVHSGPEGTSSYNGLLGRFCFLPNRPVQQEDLASDLHYLGGDRAAEYWQAEGEVVRGREDSLSWAATDSLLLTSLALPCGSRSDPAPVSREGYRRLVDWTRDLGYPCLLRTWNFFPGINRGQGDSERYRRFCLGRSIGLENRGIRTSDLCAGTAVGTQGDRLLIHLLAGTTPGMPVENPRQVAAYHYPRNYGLRSPSFARAMAVGLGAERHGLLISGTASIVGHRTIHPGQTLPQLEETIQNLEALVSEAGRKLGKASSPAFGRNSMLRVYVRHGAFWEAIAARLQAVWPEASLAGLQADLCRKDLVVEIEAFHAF